MKNSYLTLGTRIRPLLRLLSRNTVSWTPATTARVLFLLQSACWSSFFSRIEKTRYGRALKEAPVPEDPVFIIGHWRTGSTFLHQLMAQDPKMTAPTLLQVALPENFLVSRRFYTPLFNSFMGKSRPMDNVKIGVNEPQEDEYATFRMTTISPLEQLIFPKTKAYFLDQAKFQPSGTERDQWVSALREFFRKVHFQTGRQIVSKNPFNSLRIPLLAEVFPKSKFIHIVRHPYDVVPSTKHLWEVVQKENILNRNSYIPDAVEIARTMTNTLTTIQCDSSSLSQNRIAEIRFEDLEKDPVENLRALYNKLELPFSEDFDQRLKHFIQEIAGYKKNRYAITGKEKKEITDITYHQMERYQYLEND